MTSDEIKRCLECCINCDCKNCPCDTENDGCKGIDEEEILAYINQLEEKNNRQQAEIKKLHNIIPKMINTAKSEAIKEFAERLKEKTISMSRFEGKKHYVNDFVDTKDIDNLVKEMVGEIS